MSRRIVFESSAFADFNEWARLDKKIYRKIVELIKDIDRSPFEGLGKPQPLKYELSGFWSRRIDNEHRLVYQVTDEEIAIVACKYHYSEAELQVIFSASEYPVWSPYDATEAANILMQMIQDDQEVSTDA